MEAKKKETVARYSDEMGLVADFAAKMGLMYVWKSWLRTILADSVWCSDHDSEIEGVTVIRMLLFLLAHVANVAYSGEARTRQPTRSPTGRGYTLWVVQLATRTIQNNDLHISFQKRVLLNNFPGIG